jgi:F-type H+-transporting ATPase subunit b
MTMFPLLLAAAEGGSTESIARSFGVDWPHFAAQLVSFSIVCAVLYRFAYGPILAMLEARRAQIAQGLANAAQIQAELQRTEARRAEVLAAAEVEVARLIEEGRAAAARVQQEETRKAVASAEDIVRKAREAAAQDHARMLAELRSEVGRLVVQTTAALMPRILTPDDQQSLAEETARRLSA